MNKTILRLAIACISFALLGCSQTRYITERYIKNNIENHVEGEYSSIRTYTIYKGMSLDGASYLELTGYKYGTRKGLIIGVDQYFKDREKFKGDKSLLVEYRYIELSQNQTRSITENYTVLKGKISKERPRSGEEIYHDYTVSKDMFISFRKATATGSGNVMDLWISKDKYSIQTNKLIRKLNKFLQY